MSEREIQVDNYENPGVSERGLGPAGFLTATRAQRYQRSRIIEGQLGVHEYGRWNIDQECRAINAIA